MPRNVIKPAPTLAVERTLVMAGHHRVAGVDEVGVGALAGPLIAAAVVLPLPRAGLSLDEELAKLAGVLGDVRDSKQVKVDRKEGLCALIREVAAPDIGIGVVGVAELGQIGNQVRAATIATARALDALPTAPDIVLLDGVRPLDTVRVPQVTVAKRWHGTTSLSIAAASIIASVTQHRAMVGYGELYPAYGFQRHNGHVSPAHLAALAEHGPSPIHHPHHRLVQAAMRAVSV